MDRPNLMDTSSSKAKERTMLFQVPFEKQHFVLSNTSASQQVNKRQEHEVREMQASTEKMSNLHTRLIQEAEKIRKWKHQTEIELVTKNKKIAEATSNIEQLRKSILDLQIQNEELSSKLMDEFKNRQEVARKLNTTRVLVYGLREYSGQVEQRIRKGEKASDSLANLESDHSKRFDELTTKFVELKIEAQYQKKQLVGKLETEKEEKAMIQKEHQAKIVEAKSKLQNLETECREKNRSIDELSTELQGNKELLNSLKTEKDELERKLQELEFVSEDQESQLSQQSSVLDQLKLSKVHTEESLNEAHCQLQNALVDKERLVKHFEDSEKLYLEKIKTIQEDLEKKCDLLQDSEKTVEELKCNKDALILEKFAANTKIKSLQDDKARMEVELKTFESKIKELEGEITSGRQTEERLKMRAEDFETNLKETEKKMLVLEEEKKEVERNIKYIKEDMAKLQGQLSEVRSDLSESLRREKTASKEYQTQSDELKEYMTKLYETTTELDGLNKEKKSLKNDLEVCEAERDELSSKLEDKSKEVGTKKSESTKKNKQIKELETEVQNLKKKMNKQEKLENELGEEKARLENEISQVQKEKQELEKEVEKEKTSCRDLEKKLATVAKEKEKEQEAIKRKYAGELAKHLDDNKNMNEKTSAAKDAEIKKIRLNLNKETEEKQKHIRKLEEDLDKIKERLAESENKSKEMNKLEQELANTKSRLTDSEKQSKQVEKLEDELAETQARLTDSEKKSKEMNKLEQEVAKLRDRLTDTEKKAKQVPKLEVELTRTKKRLTDTEKKSGKLQEDIKKQKSIVQEKEKSMEAMEDEVELLKETQKSKEAELNEEKEKRRIETNELREEVNRLKIAAVMAPPPIGHSTPILPPPITTPRHLQVSPKTRNTVIGCPKGMKVSPFKMRTLEEEASRSEQKRGKATKSDDSIFETTPASKSATYKLKAKTPLKGSRLKFGPKPDVPGTPLRSCLKSEGEAPTKKRRVVISDAGFYCEPDSEYSESDVSDTGITNKYSKIPAPKSVTGTPLRKALTSTPQRKILTTTTSTPQRKGSSTISPQRKFFTSPPSYSRATPSSSKKVAAPLRESTNTRMTPSNKLQNRISKRMTPGRKHPKQSDDLSWVDTDPVFGFGPED